MAINWDQYLKEVLPDVAGCPVQVAINAIRQSAIDFCNETRVWREQIQDVSLVQSTAVYTLDTTGAKADANVLAVHRARLTVTDIPLSTIPKQELDDTFIDQSEDQPYFFNNDEPSEIRFYPTPDQAYTCRVFAHLKPTQTATTGPDFLFDDWLEPIAHGAKARLLAMEGRAWANPNAVLFHRREFINGTVEARIRDAKSNVQSSTVMRPIRKFGRYVNSRYFK